MPGPPPKPTALKQLEGNPGKRRLNRKEPKFSCIQKCPSFLDAEAKREWRRISAELLAVGLLTSADRVALAGYCAAFSRWVKAEKLRQQAPAVLQSKRTGALYSNPIVGEASAALDQLRKYLIEFGLTPASRSRLQIEPSSKDTDPFTEFMASIGANDISEGAAQSTDDVCGQSAPVLPGCSSGEDSGESLD